MHRSPAPVLRIASLGLLLLYSVIVAWAGSASLGQLGALTRFYASTILPGWVIVGLALLVLRMVWNALRGRDPGGRFIIVDFFVSRWAADRCASVIVPPLIIVATLSFYNFFKQFILPSAGFGLEGVLVDLDRAVLGRDAWRVTHGLLWSPSATQAVDHLYHGWFLPMVLGAMVCSFAPAGSPIAARYLLAYVTLWTIQGSILAYLVPAAGPWAVHLAGLEASAFGELGQRLVGQDAALRAQGSAGVAALQYQANLLSAFGGSGAIIGGGISAMPSLHNAMTALFACAGWSIHRRLGLLLWLYAAAILVGSVHLGWHYLSDGVLAIAVTALTWRGTAWLAMWMSRRTLALPRDVCPPAAAIPA